MIRLLAGLALLAGCNGAPPESRPGRNTTPADCATPIVQYLDYDADGYGRGEAREACELLPFHAVQGGDCDDGDPAVNPGAQEVCDEFDVDEDCSGQADDADPGAQGQTVAVIDGDGDGYGLLASVCDPPVVTGAPIPEGDCDDSDPTVHPGAPDPWADGVDQDCDGADDLGLREDFETGLLSPAIWEPSDGEVQDYASCDGERGMWLDRNENLRTIAFDTTSCGDLQWSVCLRNATGYSGLATVALQGQSGWSTAHTLDIPEDSPFVCLSGVEAGADFKWSGFRFRVGVLDDGYFSVDSVDVGCRGPDGDGDGHGALEDCDDTDPDHHGDCATCVDPDGDGFGEDCDPGPDCDPNDAAFHAAAPDAPGDGIDHDCDGVDGKHQRLDFETGEACHEDLGAWSEGAAVDDLHALSGNHSLRLSPGGEVEMPWMDTTACDRVAWSYLGLREPDLVSGDALILEYFDGAAWVEADRQVATGEMDHHPWRSAGEIVDGAALHDRLRVRLSVVGSGSFLVDDWVVGCTEDADGDTFLAPDDCDDADPWHWSDCAVCDDLDGDGFGGRCDLGPDCDDTDFDIAPGMPELDGDGVDSDCDGLDDDVWRDGFEGGLLDPARWVPTGDVALTDVAAATGRTAVRLRGDGAELAFAPIDGSTCLELGWVLSAKRGPGAPGVASRLVLEGFDGAGWVELAGVQGTGASDPDFAFLGGATTAPWALDPAVDLRLRLDGGPGEAFLVDDIAVGCVLGDVDADGVSAPLDCDDADPAHVRDCWTCTDADGDGVFARCDHGRRDCAPGDPLVHPSATDPLGDGVDDDCNGFDGPGFRETFERGAPDPAIWADPVGSWGGDDTYVVWGERSLELTDDLERLGSWPMDTSVCDGVYRHHWHGGGDVLDLGAELLAQRYGPTGWETWSTTYGASDDGIPYRSEGVWVQADGLYATYQAGFLAQDLTQGSFHLDEIQVRCGSVDLDLDGRPASDDCDDLDDTRWSDCGQCVDADGDGYGAGCDLGEDCDDQDVSVHPGRIDTGAAGVDVNCDGLVGALVDERFDVVPPTEVMPLHHPFEVPLADRGVLRGPALLLSGPAIVQTRPADTSSCPQVGWFLTAQRGQDAPEPGDRLEVEFFDGLSWVSVDSLDGTGQPDSRAAPWGGVIDLPEALRADFSLRLRATGDLGWDTWIVDDLRVACVD